MKKLNILFLGDINFHEEVFKFLRKEIPHRLEFNTPQNKVYDVVMVFNYPIHKEEIKAIEGNVFMSILEPGPKSYHPFICSNLDQYDKVFSHIDIENNRKSNTVISITYNW